MNIGSNCILTNCDLAKTMRKLCKVVAINENGYYKYIIAPHDEPKFLISALESSVRPPKSGEVKAMARLFD